MNSLRRGLTAIPGRFVVCRYGPDELLPTWLLHEAARVWSVTRTPTEMSVVCDEDDVPPSVTPAPLRWRAFQVDGPIPFDELGVIAGLSAPLAAAGVPVFVISTHDTDLVLVPEEKLPQALESWKHQGIVTSETSE